MIRRVTARLLFAALCLGATGCKLPKHSPFGVIDTLEHSATAVLMLHGWALDPDRMSAAVTVRIIVNGVEAATVTTERVSNETSLAPAEWAGRPLFSAVVQGRYGVNRVCAIANNLGRFGSSRTISCKTLTVTHDPNGALTFARSDQPGEIHAGGWAYDPDDPNVPVTYAFSMDGAPAGTPGSTDPARSRSPKYDVEFRYGRGTTAGFGDYIYGVSPGTHEVCAFAQNLGEGSDRILGCSLVDVQ